MPITTEEAKRLLPPLINTSANQEAIVHASVNNNYIIPIITLLTQSNPALLTPNKLEALLKATTHTHKGILTSLQQLVAIDPSFLTKDIFKTLIKAGDNAEIIGAIIIHLTKHNPHLITANKLDALLKLASHGPKILTGLEKLSTINPVYITKENLKYLLKAGPNADAVGSAIAQLKQAGIYLDYDLLIQVGPHAEKIATAWILQSSYAHLINQEFYLDKISKDPANAETIGAGILEYFNLHSSDKTQKIMHAILNARGNAHDVAIALTAFSKAAPDFLKKEQNFLSIAATGDKARAVVQCFVLLKAIQPELINQQNLTAIIAAKDNAHNILKNLTAIPEGFLTQDKLTAAIHSESITLSEAISMADTDNNDSHLDALIEKLGGSTEDNFNGALKEAVTTLTRYNPSLLNQTTFELLKKSGATANDLAKSLIEIGKVDPKLLTPHTVQAIFNANVHNNSVPFSKAVAHLYTFIPEPLTKANLDSIIQKASSGDKTDIANVIELANILGVLGKYNTKLITKENIKLLLACTNINGMSATLAALGQANPELVNKINFRRLLLTINQHEHAGISLPNSIKKINEAYMKYIELQIGSVLDKEGISKKARDNIISRISMHPMFPTRTTLIDLGIHSHQKLNNIESLLKGIDPNGRYDDYGIKTAVESNLAVTQHMLDILIQSASHKSSSRENLVSNLSDILASLAKTNPALITAKVCSTLHSLGYDHEQKFTTILQLAKSSPETLTHDKLDTIFHSRSPHVGHLRERVLSTPSIKSLPEEKVDTTSLPKLKPL